MRERKRERAPFLKAQGTQCISRSGPRPPQLAVHIHQPRRQLWLSLAYPPQCMLASLADVSVAAGPASHAHPVASKRPRDLTPHAYAAFCVGVPAVARCPPPSHAGRGEYSGSVLLSDVPPPLREAHTPAADHVVTTCSVALQLASASPWTSLSWPHTPAPAQTPLLISQSHPSEMTPRDGPQRQIWARTFGKKFG
jgi:hypothetical protein